MNRGREGERLLAENLDKFPDGAVDQAELVRHMMDNGLQISLAENLDKFQPEAVNQPQLVRNLLESGEEGRQILIDNLHKFQEVPPDVRDRLPAAK